MSIKAVDFEWKSSPVPSEQYKVNFVVPQKDCTFFKSFVKNNEVYRIGDYAVVKVEKKNVIGRLLCLYESKEDYDEFEKYRGIIRLYKKPEELDIYEEDKLQKNEIVEDNIIEDIFLEDVKHKCMVIVTLEEETLDDIPENAYLLRYQISKNSSLIPILSDEALKASNCFNQFPQTTPRKTVCAKFKVVCNSPSGIPYVKKVHSTMKKTPLKTEGRFSAVKRNLNDSFSETPKSQDGGTPVLNYSLVENTINHEEESIKLKFRLSQKQSLVIPVKKLDDNILNEYLNRDDEVQEPQVRRSSRTRTRLSYTDYLTPTKRGRKKSVDSDILTPSKDLTKVVNSTPTTKRRQTAKEGTPKKIQKTVEAMEVDSPTQQQPKTPSKYLDYVSTPSTLPKKSILKLNTKTATPRKSVCYHKDDDVVVDPTLKIHPNILENNSRRSSLRRSVCNKFFADDFDYDDTSDSDYSIKTPPKRRATSLARTPRKSTISENTSAPKTTKRTPNKVKKTAFGDSENSDSDYPVKTPSKIAATTRARTPRKASVSEDSAVPKTPRSLKTPRKSAISEDFVPVTPKTPGARAKLIREGLITPSVQHRATPVKAQATPLNEAKTKLHVSYVPKALACREKEFNDVFNFVEGKLLDGCGGCMYVSGVPGTGKTATVTEVIRKLQALAKSSKVPDFEYVSINGMKLSEPRQSYVEILRQLNGKTVRWEQAQSMLDAKFTKTGHKNKPIVLLVDELDILCTKRQDVVYNLLDWPTKAKAQLIVITIANTMDLPERLLMGRVTSRLGLTRLTFQAYTHKQLQEIVTNRLVGTNAFNPDAVQLVARKVASVSGDARRALDICRRAAELAELEGDNTLVSMKHVNDALNAMITQPKVRAIKHCTRLQQLILQAVVAEVERTGVEETTFADVYTMLVSVAALDGFQMVSCTVALGAVSRLGACRLLLTEPTANDFNQKLILNVSSDDVFYALRKD